MARPTWHHRARRAICFALMWIVAGAMVVLAGRPAAAQSGWSRPELIYETTEAIDVPYAFADSFGTTHLIWRETVRDRDTADGAFESIYYTNDAGGRWNPGHDIMVMGSASGPKAAVDSHGVIHLIWHGPNNTLFHSLAGIDAARTALGWVEPVAIGTGNINAFIVVDNERVAHVVFPGTQASGPFYVRYDVDRDAWSFPVSVSVTARSNTSADYTRLAIGPDGTLHIVWTEFLLPDGWPPTGLYYAHSTDDGATWSRSVELAAENSVQANVAVDPLGRVHVVWNGVVGFGGRYHQWSDDNGLSWSATTEVVEPGLGGTEGPPQLAIDSAGTVHFLSTYSGCAHYAAWSDGEWTEPVCISGREAMASNWIEQPALAITNGNELHAIFWDDRARLWHTSTTVDAPFVEPEPRPEEPAPAAAVDLSTSGAAPEATAAQQIDLSSLPPPAAGFASGPGRALYPAALAAAAVLGLVLLIKVIRSR